MSASWEGYRREQRSAALEAAWEKAGRDAPSAVIDDETEFDPVSDEKAALLAQLADLRIRIQMIEPYIDNPFNVTALNAAYKKSIEYSNEIERLPRYERHSDTIHDWIKMVHREISKMEGRGAEQEKIAPATKFKHGDW